MALEVYRVSLKMIEGVRPLIGVVARRDRALADQMRRAATSVPLNIAEGTESLGGNKRVRFRTAAGSAAEVDAALEVSVAWGYVTAAQAREVRGHLDRIRRMLSRLGR